MFIVKLYQINILLIQIIDDITNISYEGLITFFKQCLTNDILKAFKKNLICAIIPLSLNNFLWKTLKRKQNNNNLVRTFGQCICTCVKFSLTIILKCIPLYSILMGWAVKSFDGATEFFTAN